MRVVKLLLEMSFLCPGKVLLGREYVGFLALDLVQADKV